MLIGVGCRYKSAEDLHAFPSEGRLGSYSGGGYVLELKGPTSTILQRLQYIQQQKWIDERTRAVMLEFSVYNTNVSTIAVMG